MFGLLELCSNKTDAFLVVFSKKRFFLKLEMSNDSEFYCYFQTLTVFCEKWQLRMKCKKLQAKMSNASPDRQVCESKGLERQHYVYTESTEGEPKTDIDCIDFQGSMAQLYE